jgi:hypothetical protein
MEKQPVPHQQRVRPNRPYEDGARLAAMYGDQLCGDGPLGAWPICPEVSTSYYNNLNLLTGYRS